jgi:hypothetical protein
LQKEEGNLCGLRSGEQEEDVVGRTISWKIRLPVDRGTTTTAETIGVAREEESEGGPKKKQK